MEPLERAISDVLIPEFTGQTCTEAVRNLLALPVRLGGLGLINPVENAAYEFNASTAITEPLVQQIVRQEHEIRHKIYSDKHTQGEGGASSNNPSRSKRRSPFKDPKSSCPGLRKERLKLAHGYSFEGHEL